MSACSGLASARKTAATMGGRVFWLSTDITRVGSPANSWISDAYRYRAASLSAPADPSPTTTTVRGPSNSLMDSTFLRHADRDPRCNKAIIFALKEYCKCLIVWDLG